MKIAARALHNSPAQLVPSAPSRTGAADDQSLFADPTLQAATSHGWDFLCPHSFEAVWNGGPGLEDIEVRPQGFAVSRVGRGVLTFETGYEISLAPGHDLWVRGPTNHLKDGIQPLDQLIEADLLPFVGAVNWRFTRPNEIVRFERDEPFGTLAPYPANYIQRFEGTLLGAGVGTPPPVSCICLTYGRPELLEEAIQSFLQQDYPGPKELIILNDCGDQVLEFEHPEVLIVNVPTRFRTLGEKYNAAAALCSHDVVFIWDDDDIYLPHRLTLSVQGLDRGTGYFKPGTAFFWNDGRITSVERNTFHAGSCWSRDRLMQLGGYPHLSVGVDQAVERILPGADTEATCSTEIAENQNFHLYRWSGTGSYHLSFVGHDLSGPNANYEAAGDYVREALEAGRLSRGRIGLEPRWRQDYAALVSRFLEVGPELPAEDVSDELPPIVFARLPSHWPNADALFHGNSPLKVSVVLPACNEGLLLRRTVEQFQATLPECSEIIVVDNGSEDGCADFIANDSYSDHDGRDFAGPRVRLVRTPEALGVARARNRGWDISTGEVVVFSDAHIDVPAGWWPPLVSTLNGPGVGIVGPAITVMGDIKSFKACGQRIEGPLLSNKWLGPLSDSPYPIPTLGGGFMAMRREVLDVTGAFDEGMPHWGSEDLEMCLRLWLLGYEAWVVPEVEVGHYFRQRNPYHVEPVSVTHNQLRMAILHLGQARLERFIAASQADPRFAAAMAQCISGDTWTRRAELRARRAHNDDWFFSNPHFQAMDMADAC